MGDVRTASRLELAIAQIWRDILKLDEVGIEDDFFHLGGDSLQAIEMLAAVDEVLLTPVEFPAFLDAPTVSGLARAIQDSRGGPPAPAPANVREWSGPPPCTFAQERLWFLDQLTGPTGAYNMPLGTRIRGALDVDALESAVREVVRRHNALRTTFADEAGKPFMVVSDEPRLELERLDLSAEVDPEAAAQEAVDALASTPFDLERGPLVRALLVRLADSDHVLELVFDHIVCDGWSHVVIFDELARLYDSLRRGEDPRLPPPQVQYDEYARRERERLTDAVIEEKLVYWRERLAGIPSTLELPTDRPRPPRPSFRGGTLRRHLPEASAEAIRSFARAEGATLFATLLAAYDVLLHRYSGQETIVVGSTSAARDRSELRDSVGLYASTVALRADLRSENTFRTVVSQDKQTVLEAVAHQDLPFELLVADLAPERDVSRHPIFQVFFAHVPRIPLAIDGAAPFDASPTKARFDLTLWVEEEAEGLDLVWEFSADLFDRTSIERLDRHFVSLLEAALRDPDRPIGELELITAEERASIVAQFAGEPKAFPVGCLHELFEHQAARAPDSTAVVFEDSGLSYRDLNERANRLAHLLRSLGVGNESLVALCLERSLDLVVAILAVLKAGGAYVPLDPQYPADRLAFALEDTAAPVLLTQEHLLERLPPHEAEVICLDRDGRRLRDFPATNPDPVSSPASAAYVIYTSGSTGRPKGVTVEHRNVARLFTATDPWFGFGPEDTWLLLHSYAFDFSVWELWGALLHGGRLVVVPHWTTRSPAALRDLIVEERVTVLNATPSLFLSALDDLLSAADALSLRVVVFGGEALQPSALRAWFERFGDGEPRLVNMYGITETTVHVTYRPLSAADCRRDVSPIGEPIPDLQTYVLDARLEPVPEGVPGELFVGGAGVARGYLERPELTAERFRPNPFGDGTLYRTGDRARHLNGELLYLGRLDDQVKIRGFRIELGEIESVITEHPDVAATAAAIREDTPGDRRLVAYVVPERGRTPAADDLRDHVQTRLPAFMVPSAFVTVEGLPLTPNGKLDRAALPPPPDYERPADQFVAPTTATERRIAEIWQEVLGLDAVAAGDSFFHLGGHSLLAARVVTKVRYEFEVDLSVRALFEHPVLASFAADVDARRLLGDVSAPAVDAPSAPAPAPGAAKYPLSFQQQQLLFLDDLTAGGATYYAALAFRVAGPLDRDALTRALDALFERHEVLRTVLRVDDDGPAQVVLDAWDVDVPLVEAAGAGDEVEEILQEHARRPFDLSRDLMLRTTLLRLGPDDHVVLFQTHHVTFDAWSVEIFLRELALAYEAFVQGREPHLPPLPLQYRDFALWQRETLTGERLDQETGFWRRYLAGAPTFLPLPADGPRPDSEVLEEGRHAIELPRRLTDGLTALCAAEGVTPYMLLLAAFATLLYRETGQDDLLLGGPTANRSREEFDGIVGFLANTIVTRVRLDGNPTFRELLVRVRRTVLEALEHQELPFERVVELIRPPRQTGVNPLVQVNFRTRVGPLPTLELAGTTAAPIPIQVGLARFDLAFEARVREDGIDGEFLYATALFDRTRVERWAAAFEALLEDALADPSRRVLAFELPAEPVALQSAPRIRGFRGARTGQRNPTG